MSFVATLHDNFNNSINVVVSGQTPEYKYPTQYDDDTFVIKSVNITYPECELKPCFHNWNASITFIAKREKYDDFGSIDYKTHKVTIANSYGLRFDGYLKPEVYTISNDGYLNEFTIEIESNMQQLERLTWIEVFPTANLYSIKDILDAIKSYTDISDYEIVSSFVEDFGDIKVYSANYKNDDNNYENLMKILNDILTAFSMNAYLTLTNVLLLCSCEKMYDADNLFPDENWGRDSTNYSVSKKCDTCSVQASIYDLEDIIGNLGFDNSNKLLDQKMMKIQRGKETKLFASRGTYHEYSREIREFQPNATMWKFHKYDAAGNELDEYDETQYIRNGFLATGAYPYAWGVSNEKDGFLGKEEAFLFKANAFNTKLTPYASQLANLMELNLENQVFNENEFLIFDYQLAFIGLESEDGDINSWDRGWYEDYNADNNATYSSNFDEGPVAIVHTIDDIKREQALEFFITFTDSQGVTMYWDNENKDWKSSATNTRIYTESAYEFKFAEIKKFYLSAPRNADGTIALFDNPVNQCFWVRMPATMGTLNIKIGINYTSATKYLLFRNLSCERKTALYKNINEVDLHRQDVVYSNTENDEVDMSETFYLYSKQLTAGRGQLYYQNSDNRLDELNYLTTEKEKPEWHYIRLATQMFSKAQIFNDVIKLEDVKIRYSDRFINGMNINFTDGLATITTLKTNMNINNPI